ncbi:hypothetical protein LTR36_001164 [Oleoguttula mirabilis]|uniref:Gamma-butyrobetaine dioxygenase n=1 Tax=Oleoguttula mirabilis TaxID=1507867 RepID=A0AAV9J3M9_9PEZI|nr:hypothetical protein LTR36_001164 [Oleoguttula mirabilis]
MDPRLAPARQLAALIRPRSFHSTIGSVRSFTVYGRLQQQPAPPSTSSTGPFVRHVVPDQAWARSQARGQDEPDFFPYRPMLSGPNAPVQPDGRPGHRDVPANNIAISLDGTVHSFSPLLLRDLCQCARCVDQSTRQKLFSTVEIPADIKATVVPNEGSTAVHLRWSEDIPGIGAGHITSLPLDTLRNITETGSPSNVLKPPSRILWTADTFRKDVQDIDYEAYMSDDATLYQALLNLHTHGMLFLTNVPESESAVSTIAERIGPLKNTFYGSTWDVRSVPQAKNVAYTSQHLGFHMDLLYMKQPPHLQFLHCIRSSSAGGASLFTDSHKAAQDLFFADFEAFEALSKLPVTFHYDHPESHHYKQHRHVIELSEHLFFGRLKVRSLRHLRKAQDGAGLSQPDLNISNWIDAISWSPPFQAPFSLQSAEDPSGISPLSRSPPTENLNFAVEQWHAAASKFSQLIHRPQGIYERMMRPGECVLFDNRRVLHARKAFEAGDAGKERWLRGAYLDKDPYLSKMRVLHGRFSGLHQPRTGTTEDAQA